MWKNYKLEAKNQITILRLGAVYVHQNIMDDEWPQLNLEKLQPLY